jgi:outer membrane protein TolC
MSLTTTAPVEAGTPPTAPDGPPSTPPLAPPSIQELEARLAAAHERLAAATAQRDAYRDALVRVRLAMHSLPGV